MDIPRTFGEAFRGKRSQLIQYIDISHGLLILLLDMDVISKSQKQDIEGPSTEHDKISRLLDILERRPDSLFPYFLQALDQNGQAHITDILRRPAAASAGGRSIQYVAPQVRNPSYGAGGYQSQPPQYSSYRAGGFVPNAANLPPYQSQQYAPAPQYYSQPSQARVDHDAAHARLRTEIIPAEVTMVPATQLSVPVQIAEGGFGTIYRAVHTDWGTVAFKKLKATVINTRDKVARELQREAQAQCLRHRNIVSILGIVFESGNYGVVMEYAMYGGLDDFMQKYTVEILMKMSLAHGVVLGMNYLHTYTVNGQPSPVIHGDLKIQNVLVADGYVAKICDFGLSKWKQFSTTKTNSRTVRGTVTHIPPETWKDINHKRDKKYDVYSFGILMYELLSENQAFAGAITDQIRLAVMAGSRPPVADITCDQPDADGMIEMITGKDTGMIHNFWAEKPEDRPEFSDIKVTFDSFMDMFRVQVSTSRANLDAEIMQASRP